MWSTVSRVSCLSWPRDSELLEDGVYRVEAVLKGGGGGARGLVSSAGAGSGEALITVFFSSSDDSVDEENIFL